VQLPLVVAGPGVDALGAVFVALGAAQPVRIGIEHGVERLLDRRAHHLPKVLLDQLLVDVNDLAQGLGRLGTGGGASRDRRSYGLFGHVGLWFGLSVNPPAANPYKMCETCRTLSALLTIATVYLVVKLTNSRSPTGRLRPREKRD
jgi:hypothetical protein